MMEISGWLPKGPLILAAIVAIIVSVLSIFGFLTNIPWLSENITLIILILLALITLFLTTQKTDYSQEVNSKIEGSTACLIEEIGEGTIKYREVSSLTDEHYFRRSINLIEKGYYSYHLGYYDISENPVPLISYIIIDSKEVVLGFYRVPVLPLEGEVYLCITQSILVRLFRDYFETLWTGSTKVKEADWVNKDLISQIKKKLNIEGG